MDNISVTAKGDKIYIAGQNTKQFPKYSKTLINSTKIIKHHQITYIYSYKEVRHHQTQQLTS